MRGQVNGDIDPPHFLVSTQLIACEITKDNSGRVDTPDDKLRN